MYLKPKNSKHKKIHRGKLKRLNFNSNKIIFGTVGLKAKESGIIFSNQIEAARQSINRKLKRKGKIWIRIFPFLPITKKPSEVRMGKGKGNIDSWVSKIKGGTVLFEICGISFKKAKQALNSGGTKLPLKTKVVK